MFQKNTSTEMLKTVRIIKDIIHFNFYGNKYINLVL